MELKKAGILLIYLDTTFSQCFAMYPSTLSKSIKAKKYKKVRSRENHMETLTKKKMKKLLNLHFMEFNDLINLEF